MGQISHTFVVLLQDPSLQRAGITGGHNNFCSVYICGACNKPSTSYICYISLHQRCEDNSNDLILLRDKQESQTSICLRAVARGSGCEKRRSGRGASKARNAAKCIRSLGSPLLPPRQVLSEAFLQGLILSLKTTAKSLTHSAPDSVPRRL